MNIHTRLLTMFPFAAPTLSIHSKSDIKDILYRKPNGTVYSAAFSRDLKKEFTIPAFDLLADELYEYLNNKTVETKASFDMWHHSVCDKFLSKLNITSDKAKKYGKAQKALNMAIKYAYCCNDAVDAFPCKKFTYAHMALDGYTYIGANKTAYPLSFCRNIVFLWKYGKKPRNRQASWSKLEYSDYSKNVEDISDFIVTHPHTFNEYLTACHSAGLFSDILPLSKEDDRILTQFEAEFFIWEICKNNKRAVFSTLY